jgi:uncharacterized protein (TIGR03435 family)
MRRLLIAGAVCGMVGSLVTTAGTAAQAQGGEATVVVGGAAPAGGAPAAPLGPMSFEVASVRPNNSGDGNIRFGLQPGGRFIATNAPVRQLIVFAYQLQNFQLLEAPPWTQNERYDIQATAGRELPPTAPGQLGPIQMMVRSLLEERFKLRVRQETREMPIYALVVDRQDGRLGSSLRQSTTDCAAIAAAARGRGGAPPALPDPNQPIQCGMFGGPGRLRVGSQTMAAIARSLSGNVQRVVVDKTGLAGNWDFELTYTPDQLPQGPAPPGAPPLPASDGPSIFTALQEQLGLRLQAERGPVEVVVVESVERATPD